MDGSLSQLVNDKKHNSDRDLFDIRAFPSPRA